MLTKTKGILKVKFKGFTFVLLLKNKRLCDIRNT